MVLDEMKRGYTFGWGVGVFGIHFHYLDTICTLRNRNEPPTPFLLKGRQSVLSQGLDQEVKTQMPVDRELKNKPEGRGGDGREQPA